MAKFPPKPASKKTYVTVAERKEIHAKQKQQRIAGQKSAYRGAKKCPLCERQDWVLIGGKMLCHYCDDWR